MQEIRSQKVEIKEEKDRVSKPLRDYFRKTQTKEQRDIQIYQAFKDGYSQGKIAKEVGISQPAVFKIVKKLKERN